MSGTLSPMTGMGSNGLAAGMGSQIPLPLMMQMMQRSAQPVVGTPMSGMMQHTPPMGGGPMPAPAMMAGPTQPPQGMSSMLPSIVQMLPTIKSAMNPSTNPDGTQNGALGGLLSMLSSGQSGVSPQMAPPVLPGVQAGSGLLGGGQGSLMNLPLFLRGLGMGGGFTGGAPT